MTRRRGFTLIELLIVVVIIGILAAIAIPKFGNSKERAYLASMKSDLRNLVTAQESYFTDNNSQYSLTIGALGSAFRTSTGVTVTMGAVTSTGWSATAEHRATTKTCALSMGGTATADGAPVCN
ncbi:MAG: type II secretion system protein [Gemmatimonadetes bacterium]|nr:type II secretion system protein [Gemmatimonadota bacterium]